MKIGIAYDTPEMYDFAFSFAGEDRKTAESIKNYLTKQNYTVFYDNDFQYDLVGKDLYSYLREIYKNKCKFVVCFISENYAKKIWTNLEFTAVKERLMSTFFASDFLIPILIDNSNILKDIPTYIGFYKHRTIKETSLLLIQKFDNSLIEDNYLYNIVNCIGYICSQINNILIKCNYSADYSHNTISINTYNITHHFIFLPEERLNIQSILVFYEHNQHPDLFISWRRNNFLNFDIHYFYKIKSTSEGIGIRELIEKLADYIIEHMEL